MYQLHNWVNMNLKLFGLLICSCFWMFQGKKAEAIRHLERIPCLKEPDEPKSKEIYYDGLVLLAVYGVHSFALIP